MKNLSLSIILLSLFSSQTFAQTTVNYFFKNTGVRVINIDSADFIRVISTIQNDEGTYEVKELYKNQTLKKIGNSPIINFNPRYNGKVLSYYPNGAKQAEESYNNGVLNGMCYYYFENNTLKEQLLYTTENSKPIIKTIQKADSTGYKFLDDNSTGKFRTVSKEGDIVEGEFLEAYKHGVWKTFNAKLNENYTDEYNKGIYVKGETKDANGKITTYDVLEKLPEFEGGLNAFGKFLAQNLTYPPSARQNKTQGRVFLSFTVESDGSITDIKVLRGVSQELDVESVRIMKKSPKWIPGVQRGVPVKVAYTIPISFQLAY